MYQNDGLTKLIWDYHDRLITVDRTFALNAAYEKIRNGLWWIPAEVRDVDNGEFYAQMKAPTRIRDATDGQIRYRWVETGPLEHYRHAQAFDYLGADVARRNPRRQAGGWRVGTGGRTVSCRITVGISGLGREAGEKIC